MDKLPYSEKSEIEFPNWKGKSKLSQGIGYEAYKTGGKDE